MKRPAIIAVLFLLTSCPAPGPPSDEPKRSTLAPPAGGSITVAYPSEPATLDPFSRAGFGTATRDLLGLMAPGLYRFGPGGRREPWLLAHEPAVSTEAPLDVTLDLRAEARWSDGERIDASDLIFTWRRALARGASWSKDPYDRIRSVEKVTPTQVRVTFTQPFVRWREIFAEVLPAHALKRAAARTALGRRWPVSGGPFVLTRWRRGLDMTFVRNPHAWAERPELDRIRVVFVPDGAAALELLERGKVDVLGPYLAPDWKRRAGTVEGATLSADRGGTFVGLVMNAEAGVLRSTRVRRALASAIDRRRVVAALIQDEGVRLDELPGLTGAPVDPGGDIHGAHRLLNRDGWQGKPIRSRSGVSLSATLAFAVDDDIAGYLARAVQRQVGHARFMLETIALERRDLEGEWLSSDRYEVALVVTRRVASRGFVAGVGTSNPTGVNDRVLNEALDHADKTGDASRASERLRRLSPVVPLYDADVVLVSVDVEQVHASATMPFWNAHEWKRAA